MLKLVGGLSNIPLSRNDAHLFRLDKEFSEIHKCFRTLSLFKPLEMAGPPIVQHCNVDDEAQVNEGETATATALALKLHTLLLIFKERCQLQIVMSSSESRCYVIIILYIAERSKAVV